MTASRALAVQADTAMETMATKRTVLTVMTVSDYDGARRDAGQEHGQGQYGHAGKDQAEDLQHPAAQFADDDLQVAQRRGIEVLHRAAFAFLGDRPGDQGGANQQNGQQLHHAEGPEKGRRELRAMVFRSP